MTRSTEAFRVSTGVVDDRKTFFACSSLPVMLKQTAFSMGAISQSGRAAEAAEPVLPTLFQHLATWGPAEVTLNGQASPNPCDGPAPLWFGHTMTTPGAWIVGGEVRTEDLDLKVRQAD